VTLQLTEYNIYCNSVIATFNCYELQYLMSIVMTHESRVMRIWDNIFDYFKYNKRWRAWKPLSELSIICSALLLLSLLCQLLSCGLSRLRARGDQSFLLWLSGSLPIHTFAVRLFEHLHVRRKCNMIYLSLYNCLSIILLLSYSN